MYKGVPIFHSIGNFVIGLDFQRWPSARRSLALRLLLSEGRLRRIVVEPIIITGSLQPRPATRQERLEIRRETEAFSRMFDSRLRVYMNYLLCRAGKTYDQASSLYEMWQRKGMLVTGRYYGSRMLAKLRTRAASA
jgi:hypothetical protein